MVWRKRNNSSYESNSKGLKNLSEESSNFFLSDYLPSSGSTDLYGLLTRILVLQTASPLQAVIFRRVHPLYFNIHEAFGHRQLVIYTFQNTPIIWWKIYSQRTCRYYWWISEKLYRCEEACNILIGFFEPSFWGSGRYEREEFICGWC